MTNGKYVLVRTKKKKIFSFYFLSISDEMFEGIITNLLTKYLGQYIEGLDKENLKIGIWGGDVLLKDLEIKKEALNEFNLGIAVKKGYLGKLVLKVPWKNLKDQPVIVEIEDVLLIAKPQHSFFAEYDPKKEEEAAQKIKQDKLSNAEAMKTFHEKGAEEENDSFVQRLVSKIIDSIQVNIKNVHIRLEDSDINFPFSLGICLGSLSVRSTDKNWNENSDQKRENKLLYKLVKLLSFSIYFDPLKIKLGDSTTEQMKKELIKLVIF